jgi:hypothetical protein
MQSKGKEQRKLSRAKTKHGIREEREATLNVQCPIEKEGRAVRLEGHAIGFVLTD